MSRVSLDAAGLEILDRATCIELLARSRTGRIAISVKALPSIVPVPFVVIGDEIRLRTRKGTSLEAATVDAVVAFEADGIEAGSGRWWSVHVTGVARHENGDAGPAAPGDVEERSAGASPACVISISTEHMSGRRTLTSRVKE